MEEVRLGVMGGRGWVCTGGGGGCLFSFGGWFCWGGCGFSVLLLSVMPPYFSMSDCVVEYFVADLSFSMVSRWEDCKASSLSSVYEMRRK